MIASFLIKVCLCLWKLTPPMLIPLLVSETVISTPVCICRECSLLFRCYVCFYTAASPIPSWKPGFLQSPVFTGCQSPCGCSFQPEVEILTLHCIHLTMWWMCSGSAELQMHCLSWARFLVISLGLFMNLLYICFLKK